MGRAAPPLLDAGDGAARPPRICCIPESWPSQLAARRTAFEKSQWRAQPWKENSSEWVKLARIEGNNRVKRTVSFKTQRFWRLQVIVEKAASSGPSIVELEAYNDVSRLLDGEDLARGIPTYVYLSET